MNHPAAATVLMVYYALYAIDILGNVYSEKDVERLDQAYVELRQLGLLAPMLHIIHGFREPRRLYRITQAGRERARELIDATAAMDLKRWCREGAELLGI